MMPETTASKVAIAITTKFTHVNIGESVSVAKPKCRMRQGREYTASTARCRLRRSATRFSPCPSCSPESPCPAPRNKADGRHSKFADHNKEHKYRVCHAVRHKADKRRHHHDLIGQGVHQLAEICDEVIAPRDFAVQVVGVRRNAENCQAPLNCGAGICRRKAA